MTRKVSILLCLVLLLGIFSGCGSDKAYVPTGDGLADYTRPTDENGSNASDGQEGTDEVYTLAYYPSEGFNPYQCTSVNNRMLFSLLYQGLFAVDRNYNVEPILCKSYTISEDMKTHTFQLEDATFSDGTALSAGDVVASLNAAWESDLYKGRFDHVSSISAIDASTVQIITTCAYENLPILLDVPILKQSQVGDTIPLGTGPYVLKNTVSGMMLQRRSDWWCRAELPISANSVPLTAGTSAAQIRDAFEFDSVGISISDPGSASYAEYRCDYELWEEETGIMLYLACNMESRVFSNDAVRAALTYAIDRAEILSKCYNGFGAIAVLPASPNSPYYDRGLASQVTYDAARLEQAVADGGFMGETVKLLVNKSDSVRLQAARLISDMLEDCGLQVEILTNSTSYFRQQLTTDNYDLYLGQTKLSANMDLSQFFSSTGGLSYGDMDDAVTYSMCLEALENSGNYYNLHQMVLKDGQLVPILFRTHAVYATRGLARDLAPARDNIFYYSLGKSMDEITTIDYDE